MTQRSSQKAQSVRAVQRAVEILQCFDKKNPSMTVSEIQKHVRLSRATLYRLLYTLQESGLVKVSGTTQRYELDWGVVKIAHAWFSTNEVADVAKPILSDVWERLNETVALMIPKGSSRVCVVELPGRQDLSYSRGLGDVDHMAATASGRAILAFLPEAEIDTILSERTREKKAELRNELTRIRKNGFARSGGSLAGILGVAAPVFDSEKAVVASVSITGPEVRLGAGNIDRYIKSARKAAADVSRALGYRP